MRVLGVQTGTAQTLLIDGRRILSAIGKQPATGPLAVGALGLHGDEQADPSVHGGLSKAVYAYPSEHLPFWQAERQAQGVDLFNSPLPHGFMGENLSLQGLLEHEVWVGDTLHFPHCVLRVSEPRQPCFKFNAVMGFNLAGKRMAQSGHCGFYLAVQTPGTVQAGEAFELHPGPRSLSIAQAFAGKRWKHLR
jgi:MOSC domain-containing protein YiiM